MSALIGNQAIGTVGVLTVSVYSGGIASDSITGTRWEAVAGGAPWAFVSGTRWEPIDGGEAWAPIRGDAH